jgi:hypothetical protein
MNSLAETIDAWPLAARLAGAISSSPNIWQVVVGKPEREVEAADALVVELESLYDGPIRRVAAHSVEEWLAAIAADEHDVLVLSLESRLDERDWRNIDMQRSRLMRDGMTILVVSEDDLGAMVTDAPNLWSWIAGMVWALRVEEDPDE